MNLLKTIIERLNQRVEVANIFDKQFGLCELNANGNDKAWVHYIGNGQAEVVTNFDAKQGTLFWAKRGKVTVAKTDAYKMSGCKQLYVTSFPLTAYAVVRKSHLPCDGDDAQDWLASRIYKLTSGTDPQFKQNLGVINYEVIPSGYINEIKTLTANYEFACVTVDFDIQVITTTEDGCYDICATGDIPLPDFQPCTPCLTEVAVDEVTITGNGTPANPLVAVGGGGGTPLITKEEGTNVSTNTTTLNFTGEGVTASLTSPGVVEVNVPGGTGDVGTLQEVTDLGNSTTNDIAFTASAGLSFDNGAFFRKGTTDAGNGGAKGTAQICSISYELKWEAGRLYYMEQDGFTIRDVTHNFAIVPQVTDDSSKGFVVGSRWSLDNGTVYLCSDDTIGAAVWAVVAVGTVTSVSASVPAALSVTVTDPTTTPAIAITAVGLATQYIRGDGQLATLPSNASGGSAVSYYLNGGTAASVATYFQMSQIAVVGTNADFTKAGNGLISQWLTDVGDPNRLEIPAGNWNFEIFMSASSAGGTPAFYVELLKYDGITFTTIADSSLVPEAITGGTIIDLYLTSLAIPQTTLLVTDRLALRVYIVNSVGGRTITMHTQDSHLCQVITNFAGGISALNGLTANTQYLAVGTAGTDFAINSTSATHTFNLPTASAANRGALSSGDFATFAAKQAAITLTTTGTSGAATLVGATLNIPQYSGGSGASYKSTTDGIATSTANITLSHSQLITGGTFAVGDIIRIYNRMRATGALGTKTMRVYVNVTNDLTGTPILIATFLAGVAVLFQQIKRDLVIKSATNTEAIAAAVAIATDDSASNSFTSSNIDWSTDKYIIFTNQRANAGDTLLSSYYLIEKL